MEDEIDDEVMLTIPDVMKLLQCSDKHITNLRKRNRIPQPVKLGQLVRWPRKAFIKWMNEGCPPTLAV
jgi:predicted DNA-binding transcriptional regulator AlpA